MASMRSFAHFSWVLCFISILHLTTAQSFQYVFDDSLPGTTLTDECSAALTKNISCDPWVSHFRSSGYYDPNGLKSVCTTSCQQAIQDYHTGLISSCAGLSYNYTDTTYLPIDAIGALLDYTYTLVCLQDSGRFCNYVAYESSLQADPDVAATLGQPSRNETISPCDSCLVKQSQLQAGSPFDGGEDLVTEYDALTSSCSVTGMPVTTITLSSSSVTTTPSPSPTCAGNVYKVSPQDSCRSIAESQGISVGWLVIDNGLNAYCAGFNATGSLCIQDTCDTYTVKTNDTCSSIAKSHNVTTSQIISWNPIFDSSCSNIALSLNDSICISKPGRPYASPTVTIPVVTSFTTAAPVPTDIATNTTQNCGKFYEVQLGDYCNLVCLKFNINLNDFLFLNPSVNVNCTNLFAEESYCVVPVGDLTSYPGYPGYVAPSNATTTFAWSDAPKATWVPPDLNITDNTPLANGTRSDCWQFTDGSSLQLPINGSIYSSTCQLIASTYGTSLDQLKNWNPSLPTNETDCSFDPSLRYCLMAYNPVVTASAAPTSSATPDQIRPGTWTNCTAYLDVNFGTSCQDILDNYNLTIAQFSSWNPEVGTQCENLWEDYRYCVSLTQTLDEAGGGSGSSGSGTASSTPTPTTMSVSSTTAKSTTTTKTSSTSTTVAIPSPTQPNSIASNCDKYQITVSGDYCYIFAQDNGITVDQLAGWNTVLGAGGANCDTEFWLGYYYCVGVMA
ncbi:hypothetical protein F4823DRAFT_113363 [Ustulina deusta]|nr:hypothetical protein F4823DRAFT_113363 [Ustulina deusta]